MRNPVIRLVDLGLDDDFGLAMQFAQSALGSINVSGIRSEIEYLRTTDTSLIARFLTLPARLIHIMGHGGDCGHGDPGFEGRSDSGQREVRLGLHHLADYLQAHGEGIETVALFADACDSAQHRFTDVLRDSIEQPLIYIGATGRVDWHECTTFDAILYGSMLRRKGRGTDQYAWMREAVRRSIVAYETAVDGPCPFKMVDLVPSRAAHDAFRNARTGHGLE